MQQRSKAASKPSISRETLITAITMTCIFLFTYTGYLKLTGHDRFQQFLAAIPYLGTYAQLISWMVPIGELAIALLLILPRYRPLGLKLFAASMGIFSLYIASMLIWATHLPCSCGGVIEKLSWREHLWFNLGFLALSILAIRLSGRQPKILNP